VGHLTEQDVWNLASGETASSEANAHVKTCGACRVRLEQAAGVRQLARAARAPEASPSSRVAGLDRFERVMNLEQRRAQRWLDRRPLLFPALGLAAAAGAAAVLMVGGNPTHMQPPRLGEQPVAQVVVRAAPVPLAAVNPMEPAVAPENLAEPVAANTPAPTVRQRARKPITPVPAAIPPEPAPLPPPAMLAAAPMVPVESTVSVEAVYRYARVAALRELLRQGDAPAALVGAVALLTSQVPGEAEAAVQVIREAALQQPSEDMVARVDSAAAEYREGREALTYLACEAAVLGKRPQEAVERCRTFASEFPASSHARDASYVAGTLARESLNDCEGAVEDYRKALVFTGALGSLNDDAWFWRAHCLAQLGRMEEGRKDLATFLGRYPSRRVDPKVRALQQKLSH
jgi:TolA-binding protein